MRTGRARREGNRRGDRTGERRSGPDGPDPFPPELPARLLACGGARLGLPPILRREFFGGAADVQRTRLRRHALAGVETIARWFARRRARGSPRRLARSRPLLPPIKGERAGRLDCRREDPGMGRDAARVLARGRNHRLRISESGRRIVRRFRRRSGDERNLPRLYRRFARLRRADAREENAGATGNSRQRREPLDRRVSANLRAGSRSPRRDPSRGTRGHPRDHRLLPGVSHLRAGRERGTYGSGRRIHRPGCGRGQGGPRRSRRRVVRVSARRSFIAHARRGRGGFRHALSAIDRSGDGQGRGGHSFLLLQPAGRAQRSRRRSQPFRRIRRRLSSLLRRCLGPLAGRDAGRIHTRHQTERGCTRAAVCAFRDARRVGGRRAAMDHARRALPHGWPSRPQYRVLAVPNDGGRVADFGRAPSRLYGESHARS